MPLARKKALVNVRFDFASDFVIERPNTVTYLNKRIGRIAIWDDLTP